MILKQQLTVVGTHAPSFGDEIREAVKEHQDRVIGSVRKWIHYWAGFGVSAMALEDCPHIVRTEWPFVIEWLRSEGFQVDKPRLWGRVMIRLETPVAG